MSSLDLYAVSLSFPFSITESFCACSPEVTVTSLHPPRLCRLAVFSIKSTFPVIVSPASADTLKLWYSPPCCVDPDRNIGSGPLPSQLMTWFTQKQSPPD